jgi:signal transduction histidine kinase
LKRLGVRSRLTAWFVLGFALFAATGVWATHALLQSQLHDGLDEDLRESLVHFGEAVARADGEEQLLLATRVFLEGPASSHLREQGFVFALRSAGGAVISNSGTVLLDELPHMEPADGARLPLLETVQLGEQEYRVAVTPVRLGEQQLGLAAAGGSLSPLADTGREVLLVLTVGAIVGTLAAGVASWVLVGRTLRPVQRISRTAASISRHDLKSRIGYAGPRDEIGELAETMDAMLDRLEEAFSSQERFISDVSHELRTPLTVMKGHLQVLSRQEEVDREALREGHGLVLDELDRMNRLVSELLMLSRAGRTDFLHKEVLEIDSFLTGLAAQGPYLGDRDWTVEALPGGTVEADQDRLTQAFLNLMQNALAHTRPGDRIALGGLRELASLRLWVRDGGEGMPPEVRARVFERFYRGPSASAGPAGLGLGLAIVQGVATAHEGRVEIESEPGSGACVAIILPI